MEEDDDEGSLPASEDDIDGGVKASSQPATRSRAHDKHERTESDLIVCLFLPIFIAWFAY